MSERVCEEERLIKKAVAEFASEMEAEMIRHLNAGWGGWNDRQAPCWRGNPEAEIALRLRERAVNGFNYNEVDAANYLMMLRLFRSTRQQKEKP